MKLKEPKPILLCPDLFDWQRWVAVADEDALETVHWSNSAVYALRWIDENERAPDFDETREEFRKKFQELNKEIDAKMPAYIQKRDLQYEKKVELYWDNFNNGIDSPDKEQRERFQELDRLLIALSFSLPEAMPILACLEPAILRKGRKGRKAVPSEKDRELLAKMKPMILHDGLSKTDAARRVAATIVKPHMLEPTVKRLVRGWNWKMSRRQFQEEK